MIAEVGRQKQKQHEELPKMLWINSTFDWLVKMAVVSLVVPTIGTLLTWC